MKTQTALPVALMAVSLALVSCASNAVPPPSPQVHPPWLVGPWEGTAWQVDASKDQGSADVSVTFASDGTWKASTGAFGISWLAGDRVVLQGSYQGGDKVRYTLKQRQRADEHELWGIVEASFGAAAVSLTRRP
jgi:hypothetical protein